MVSCNDCLPEGGAARQRPLKRAGLRQPPRGVEPTGVFVVIEMTVLLCVTALAMVSIIVSIDDGPGGPAQAVGRVDDRPAAKVDRHDPETRLPKSVVRDATTLQSRSGGAAR